MLRQIMEGNYTFSSPDWDDISEDAKDLIRHLLVVNPQQRFTVEEALNSSFFKKEVSTFVIVIYTFFIIFFLL
jgi:phosphorylase kinase gamma subunit